MKGLWRVFVMAICVSVAMSVTAWAEPGIKILGASPYGSTDGYVWGEVTGVANYSQYKVLSIIKVADEWWVKPQCNQPFTAIRPDGTWRTKIVTGGRDELAEYILAYLVPASMAVGDVQCKTYCQPSGIDNYLSYAIYDRKPSKRVVPFANQKWRVRKSELPSGPDGNLFSNLARDVWVDSSNQLHLTATHRNGKWFATEVVRQGTPLGRGVYMIQTNSRLELTDPNTVIGAFTWDPWVCDDQHRELDWEVTKWGDTATPGWGQFVVQPCDHCPGCTNHCVRFNIKTTRLDRYVTTYILWDEQKVEFRSYKGKFSELFPPPENLIKKWVHRSSLIPKAGKEQFRLNLWLVGGRPPRNGKRQEVVFSDFSFNKKALTINSCSALGSWPGYVSGMVTEGVSPDDYFVEVYIHVKGKWWTKPYDTAPLTSIKANRTWKTLITTGGIDESATRIKAFLVPKGKGPHILLNADSIPPEVYADSTAWDEVIRK